MLTVGTRIRNHDGEYTGVITKITRLGYSLTWDDGMALEYSQDLFESDGFHIISHPHKKADLLKLNK